MNLLSPTPRPIELRPFQSDMIDQTRAALQRHKAVMVQMPTGAGKTVTAAAMMQGAVQRGGRPWFVCHRDFLVDQTSLTLERFGLDHAFISAGRRWNPYLPAQVCSIDTLRNRLGRVPDACRPTVLFVDEAKHSSAASWSGVIRWAIENGAKVVGLDATPKRLDGKGLDDLYGAMILGPSVEWLIEQGYLSRYRAFAPTMPDLSGVGTRAGDYNAEQLGEVMDRDSLTGNLVEHYLRLAPGKRAIYFCVSVMHSQHVAAAFRAAGVSAVHLDAASPSDERRSAARGMAIGEIDVICNVALFGEGYDLAAQAGMDVTVECVGLARPTKSLAMAMQQMGRALRPKPDAAIILDHAGILTDPAIGLPDADREWTLEGTARKSKKSAPTAPPVRVCPKCFATCGASSRACVECGEPFPIDARMMAENDDTLVEIDPAELKRVRKMQEHQATTLDDLVAVGQARGYAKPKIWAANLWAARERTRHARTEQAAAQQKLW
jgi:superfamily II DNA or RNA helicase